MSSLLHCKQNPSTKYPTLYPNMNHAPKKNPHKNSMVTSEPGLRKLGS